MLCLGGVAGCRVVRSGATSAPLLLEAPGTQAENTMVFECALPGQ